MAARACGLNCKTMELKDGPGQDLTTETGFLNAVRFVLEIKESGLLIMAPVCSSFVFPNSSKTRRTNKTPEGDLNYPPVAAGNVMADVALFLFRLAHIRRVFAVLENPLTSFMWKQPACVALRA